MEVTAMLPGVRKTGGPGRALSALRQKMQQQGIYNTAGEMLLVGSNHLYILMDGQVTLEETLIT